MSLTNGFLIAMVLIFVMMEYRHGSIMGLMHSLRSDCIVHGGLGTDSCGCRRSSSHLEPFAACREPSELARKEPGCTPNDSYALNDYGAPGVDYKDWVAAQAIDSQVVKNHAEFVKDRIGADGQNITGRTHTPDTLEGQETPWIGLRRPQAVAVCNPTQVADVDYNWYAKKPTFTWSS